MMCHAFGMLARTCNKTKIPPRKKPTIFAPFFTNTPAHKPATEPKLSS